jgi:hypothetical protein
MEDNSIDVRMERAISTNTLWELARELKAEGMSQLEMYKLYSKYADFYQDRDEAKFDAVVDILDLIWGYCPPSKALFETTLTNDDVASY